MRESALLTTALVEALHPGVGHDRDARLGSRGPRARAGRRLASGDRALAVAHPRRSGAPGMVPGRVVQRAVLPRRRRHVLGGRRGRRPAVGAGRSRPVRARRVPRLPVLRHGRRRLLCLVRDPRAVPAAGGARDPRPPRGRAGRRPGHRDDRGDRAHRRPQGGLGRSARCRWPGRRRPSGRSRRPSGGTWPAWSPTARPPTTPANPGPEGRSCGWSLVRRVQCRRQPRRPPRRSNHDGPGGSAAAGSSTVRIQRLGSSALDVCVCLLSSATPGISPPAHRAASSQGRPRRPSTSAGPRRSRRRPGPVRRSRGAGPSTRRARAARS